MRKMKEKILILLFISVFSLCFVLANAYAAEPMSKSMKTYQISKLLSEYVEDPEGGFLGRVTDFVVDSNGHIEFAIVQVGFPEAGRDSKLVAVPFGAVSRPEGKHYVINMSRERLASAPRFDAKKDLSNSAFAESVYSYLGLGPSWTEGGHERGIRSDQDPFDLVGKADPSSPVDEESVQ
jgi:sporulation protein YlmC with PRC-barrel domain